MAPVIATVSSVAAVTGLRALLRPFAPYVLAAIFFGFFLAAAIAVAFSDRQYVRQSFVASFFVGLLLCNFVFPLAPPPFIAWGHFSEPTGEIETYHEIRLVDESGNELKMDDRLTLEFDAISVGSLIRGMREEYTEEQQTAIARQLVLEAREYREDVNQRSLVELVRFPHHGLTSVWTPELLAEYGSFVGFRVYEMTFVTSSDGTELVQYEEEVVYEAFPFDERPVEPFPQSAMPTRAMNRTVPADSISPPAPEVTG